MHWTSDSEFPGNENSNSYLELFVIILLKTLQKIENNSDTPNQFIKDYVEKSNFKNIKNTLVETSTYLHTDEIDIQTFLSIKKTIEISNSFKIN